LDVYMNIDSNVYIAEEEGIISSEVLPGSSSGSDDSESSRGLIEDLVGAENTFEGEGEAILYNNGGGIEDEHSFDDNNNDDSSSSPEEGSVDENIHGEPITSSSYRDNSESNAFPITPMELSSSFAELANASSSQDIELCRNIMMNQLQNYR